MRIKDLRYNLLPENLEGTPREIRLGRRDMSRLLVVDRATGIRSHSTVCDLVHWLTSGDVLVLNNSKRIPGVLKGRTAMGGQVELRFVNLEETGTGLCVIFPMHDVGVGSVIDLRARKRVEVMETGLTKYGLARVRSLKGSLRDLLVAQGSPILGFFYEGNWTTQNLNPYYATEEGTVESPLAGLHFTPELVRSLEDADIEVCFITLHSVGSWLPFLEDHVDEHRMWAEYFLVPEPTAAAINRAREAGRRIVACGSTSLRALESAATEGRTVAPVSGRTNLYITPGYEFRVVDAYFTNFHQYQTSLIVLDVAFGGKKLVMDTYQEASKLQYSFYEFGDAVLYL
ncbi:S-adenosylmethionine:tRNA ribosyltransferase-isomerase [Candidatus Parcubacteria bacterium]|nr:S-adenosylmethionine:tRNA ribosyltransferase-isomerase [Candidatus Parcubacteria bacterium]